ncbi:hypothetical protein NP233_g4399 [Leucocoprinus birnbaumii]|uniref:Protein kinase domain-containing protein n=1 Tax=Leucocoprinus birnbaumii TaxID=56174 RepID=A0AAD5VYH3_9AGAR|nr:hypothetical protein NP233_g4399 [Leucocoprinus birnbaumii]
MAAPLTPASSTDLHRRSNWIGGPRPPAATVGRNPTRTKDDLEVDDPSEAFLDRSFALAMLAEHLRRTGESGTQTPSSDRVSRRWALDLETEEQWLQLLQAGRPSASLHPSGSASSFSTPIDSSRWQFFGPRQPRRSTRASPVTPYTPFTPFTALPSPDTPELETPDDEVSGSHVATQKAPQSDFDDASQLGLEYVITPFLLWEPSVNSSHPSQGHASPETNDADELFGYEHRYPVIPPLRPLRVDWSRQARDALSSSKSIAPGPSTPTSMSSLKSEPIPSENSRKSSRPRLSIVTSSSWPRNSTSSRGLDPQIPSEPLPFKPLDTSKSTSPVSERLIEILAADVLQVQEKYKALLAYRGDEAQQVLDCLQVVLDSPSLRNPDRAVILRALSRLAENSKLYPRCFRLQDIETTGNEPIDGGRFGDIWKGTSHSQLVCVKFLRSYQRMPTQPLFKNLSREALLWGQLSHPNILPFYGIHINEFKRNRFGLVSPWMENGNIVNFLKQNPNVSRILLIHGIASGLQYLHSLDVVHGDIKGTNILVTSDGRACLADFGLSALLGDNILVWPSLGSEPARSGGTTCWRAPELFIQESLGQESPPTTSSDVYSFACTAYEVLTEQIPFYEIKSEGAMILAKMSGSPPTPSRPSPENSISELTDHLWCLLEDCWKFMPEDRPSLSEVLCRLERMMTPEQVERARNTSMSASSQRHDDAVLSSSRFRKSFNDSDKPSEEDLLQVIDMVSSLH